LLAYFNFINLQTREIRHSKLNIRNYIL
jgi:hypothetical protein